MNSEHSPFANLSLVANIQSLGPKTIAEKDENFLNIYQKELFCARVVVITGMGNQKSPESQLHGPVPISEIEDDHFEFYLYQIRPKIKEENLHLTYVLSFHNNHKLLLKEIEDKIEDIINTHLSSSEYLGFRKDGFDTSKKDYYISILLKIERDIIKVIEALPPKGSLFDLAYISSLEEHMQEIAKSFLFAPDGIEKSKLENASSSALEFLEKERLIKFSERNGKTYVVAR